MNARTAAALTLCLGWGCDYTPNAPTTSTTPSPGSVQVNPVGPATLATFAILNVFPPQAIQLFLPLDRSEEYPRPNIEFQFTYPRDLSLGVRQTNFVLGLTSNGTECLATEFANATRLDSNDGVYIANSVARFRTGRWVIRGNQCGARFRTDRVTFNMGPLPVAAGLPLYQDAVWFFAPLGPGGVGPIGAGGPLRRDLGGAASEMKWGSD
jgi:hypothetical protein